MQGKWVFILNPIAGNGFAAKIQDLVQSKIKDYNIAGEIVLTQQPGDATLITEKYLKKGFDHFIAVGGDGTLNEIGKVLINKDHVTIGIIPAGTGNDFIPIIGFPERFTDKDWDIFFKKNTIAIDAGSVNGIIFLNGMGLGFDAQVAAQNYDASGKTKQGSKNKYVWHILKTLFFYKAKKMIVKKDGEETETHCFINTIAVGRRFAGGFFLTPKAIANDGLLDICSIRELNLFQRVKILLKVPKGTHIHTPQVNYFQTNQLNLKFKMDVPFHVDGELNFASELDVYILPKALNIIYNPHGNHFLKI